MWYRITDKWRNFLHFFINCYKFRKELALHRGWDYQGLLMFNKAILKDMIECQEAEDIFVSVNRDKHCKRMRVCVGAIDRLIKDEYDIRNQKFEDNIRCKTSYIDFNLVKDKDMPTIAMINKHSASIREGDLKIVSKFIEKYLLSCWT